MCAHHRLHIELPRHDRFETRASACRSSRCASPPCVRARARGLNGHVLGSRAVEPHAWGCESGASGEPPMRGRRPHVCSPPQRPPELHARSGLRCAAPAMQWAAMETHTLRKPSGKSLATQSNPKSRSLGGIKLWPQQCILEGLAAKLSAVVWQRYFDGAGWAVRGERLGPVGSARIYNSGGAIHTVARCNANSPIWNRRPLIRP